MHQTAKTKSLILILIMITLLAACSSQDFSEFAESSGDPGDVINNSDQPDDSDSPAPAGIDTFLVDPVQSKASYLVDEEFFAGALDKLGIDSGDVAVVGTSQEVQGRIQLNLDDLSAPVGENEFMVNLAILKTDQDRRDKWIQNNGPNFGSYPQATFTVTEFEGMPDSVTEGQETNFQMSGDLTIRDVTKPATFDVSATLNGDTLTGQAASRLLMSDFGIEPPNFANTLSVQDEFGIVIEFVALKQ